MADKQPNTMSERSGNNFKRVGAIGLTVVNALFGAKTANADKPVIDDSILQPVKKAELVIPERTSATAIPGVARANTIDLDTHSSLGTITVVKPESTSAPETNTDVSFQSVLPKDFALSSDFLGMSGETDKDIANIQRFLTLKGFNNILISNEGKALGPQTMIHGNEVSFIVIPVQLLLGNGTRASVRMIVASTNLDINGQECSGQMGDNLTLQFDLKNGSIMDINPFVLALPEDTTQVSEGVYITPSKTLNYVLEDKSIPASIDLPIGNIIPKDQANKAVPFFKTGIGPDGKAAVVILPPQTEQGSSIPSNGFAFVSEISKPLPKDLTGVKVTYNIDEVTEQTMVDYLTNAGDITVSVDKYIRNSNVFPINFVAPYQGVNLNYEINIKYTDSGIDIDFAPDSNLSKHPELVRVFITRIIFAAAMQKGDNQLVKGNFTENQDLREQFGTYVDKVIKDDNINKISFVELNP